MLRALGAGMLLGLVPGAAMAQPVVSFEANAVLVSGVAAGGRVALLGVGREPVEYSGRVVRSEAVLTDDDGDGRVRYELETVVPWRSLWAAVDLADGEVALAAPEGYPLRIVPLPDDAVQEEGGDRPNLLVARGDLLEVLVARPGTAGGAWGLTVWDGHEEDRDGAGTGGVALRLPSLEPVGGTSLAAPDGLAAGDVLIAIDPNRMEASLVRLAPAAGEAHR